MAQIGMLVAGMLLGIILFYSIVYVIRSFLGPEVPSGETGNRFTQNWSWNIFSPQAVDYEVCKKAKVMDSSNCATHVTCPTCPTCPTLNLATDCPAAGYRRPQAFEAKDLELSTTDPAHKDELAYLDIYNSSLTKPTALSAPSLDYVDATFMGWNLYELESNVIPIGTYLDTCSNVKTYLNKVFNATLTDNQVADLTKVCRINATTGELVGKDSIDTDTTDNRFKTGIDSPISQTQYLGDHKDTSEVLHTGLILENIDYGDDSGS